jgi:flagellar hook-length control protein FliK
MEADAGVGDKNFKNTSAVEPADNLTAVSDTQSNQVEAAKNPTLITDVETAAVKSENLKPLPQTAPATNNSAAIKTADADAKKQNTSSNHNAGQKISITQPQTNAENSSQTSFEQGFSTKQGFGRIYQKVEDIESISLENKIAGDLKTMPIQEIKSAGGLEKISSPITADLKTDIKQETGAISGQITDSIKSAANSGSKEITVRLNPAELGKVVIKVSGEHSQISAIIEASNPETKSQLQEAFGQVSKNLADAGITLKQFEVRSAEQSGGRFESAFSQSGQSGQSSQGDNAFGQFFQNQNPTEGGFYYQSHNFDAANLSSEQNFAQNHFTARSVNMLA